MIVILKNIPTKTKKQDIKSFITPAVKGGWFQKKGKISGISIVSQRNVRTHVTSHHGIVKIEPDIVGARVIKKLNRKILVNKHIAVSEYKHRNIRNDHRLRNHADTCTSERRICDRRDEYEILIR